jgi:hypothetical protein
MMQVSILSVALGIVLTLENAAWTQTSDSAAPQKEQKKAANALTQQKQAKEQLIRAENALEALAQDDVDKSNKEKTSLENLIAQALKNNPDIRVAESKVREADAELNRVRFQVSQKVAVLNAEITGTKQIYAEAMNKLKTAERLLQTKSIAMEEYRSAVLTRDKFKAELARLEAELHYLLGNSAMLLGEKSADGRFWSIQSDGSVRTVNPFQAWTAGQNTSSVGSGKQSPTNESSKVKEKPMEANRTILVQPENFQHLDSSGNLFLYLNNYAQLQNKPAIPNDTADKIRKALDTPITVEFSQVPARDVLTYLKERARGFNLVEQVSVEKAAPVNLHLTEPVPVGAIFQFLEDQYGWRFVVREYGIVVADKSKVPPGAILLQDFWKNRPAAATGTNYPQPTNSNPKAEKK